MEYVRCSYIDRLLEYNHAHVKTASKASKPLCPIGSPFGDPGPLGDLFVDLGPLWVSFFVPRSPFSPF